METLPLVREALSECEFFAFDCEMTGIRDSGLYTDIMHDMDDFFLKMQDKASVFQIIQFGISIFSRERDKWVARTWNFYVFPHEALGAQDRQFSCQASTLYQLVRRGFDMDKWVLAGIGYLTATRRDSRRQKVLREVRVTMQQTAPEDAPSGPDEPARDPGNRTFVLELSARLDRFEQNPNHRYLNLPLARNSYQRWLLTDMLAKRGFVAKAGYIKEDSRRDGSCTLVRTSSQEAIAHVAALQQSRLRDLDADAGLLLVLEAMRDCGRPAVGHSVYLDLVFTLQALSAPLPRTWSRFRRHANSWFPGGLFDSKHIASCIPEVFCGELGLQQISRTLLGENSTRQASLARVGVSAGMLPHVEHADGFERYLLRPDSYQFEAGYNAFTAGSNFAKLLGLMQLRRESGGTLDGGELPAVNARRAGLKEVAALNGHMHTGRSHFPYAAIQGPDPHPRRGHMFFVTGLHAHTHHQVIRRTFLKAGLGDIMSVPLSPYSVMVALNDSSRARDVIPSLQHWSPRIYTYTDWMRNKPAEVVPPRGPDTGSQHPRRLGPPGKSATTSAPARLPQSMPDDQPDRLQDDLSDNPSDGAQRDSLSDSLQPEEVGTHQ